MSHTSGVAQDEERKNPRLDTDRIDYQPGETVTISGEGYDAGEPIELRLREDPLTHYDVVFDVVADETGAFVHSGFAPDQHDLGVAFTVIATGLTSGRVAETQFTDSLLTAAAAAVETYTVSRFRPEPDERREQLTRLALFCDDCSVPVRLPFAYTFYGKTYPAGAPVIVTSNGNLQFETNSTAFSNQTLPTRAMHHAIFPYWDDLLLLRSEEFGVETSISGIAPDRVFNVRWRTTFNASAKRNLRTHFELRLYEAEPRFDVVYYEAGDAGISATVGVQGAPEQFTLVSFNTPILQSGLALRFDARRPTTLTANDASGPYHGTADLSAQLVLSDDAAPLAGETIDFELGGVAVGSAVTDENGVATLSGVSVGRRTAGPYPGAIRALFAGTAKYRPSVSVASLDVLRANPVITWPAPRPIVYGTLLGTDQLNATADVAGAFTFTPAADTLLNAGDHTLTAEFAPEDAANYNTVTTQKLLTVNKATPAFADVASVSIVYGIGTATVTGRLAAGSVIPSGSVSVDGWGRSETAAIGGDGTFSAVLNTAGLTVADGPYPIALSFAGNENFEPANGRASLSVTPATLTITAHNNQREYGLANPVFTGTVTGLVEGDAVTVSYETEAHVGSPVGTYAIGAVFADPAGRLGNYDVVAVKGTLTVVPAPLTVVVQNASREYGVGNPAFAGTVTGIRNNDAIVVTYSTVATPGSGVGQYAITAALAPAELVSNYVVSVTPGVLTIGRAGLVVTADDKTRLLGAPNPVFTGSITGLRNSDGITITFTTTATIASPVGTYEIVPVLVDPGGRAANYAMTIDPGVLTVTYGVCALYDQTRAHRPGRTVPIKLQLCNASGGNVSASGVILNATEVVLISTLATGAPEDAGDANPDNNFRYTWFGSGPGYIFNLKTTDFQTGVYRMVFGVSGDPLTHSVQFQVR